ncbi:MAG: zinc-dependent alcohol dehydrogenase [Pigmentiphaga sp.]|uniref:zinc-dependent alcohol dehydrogenase n=1 Tax=Pigmentiphaga sp. TaxID=1977564 RepID=UPI0029BB332B|nr:zinc-dependent alcohol dehydrogenase [Pigmentiphaga sp.]MDX3905129.1 zinc-dependent alcohol dehydrogenase [Pigmentiphaga sp.]
MRALCWLAPNQLGVERVPDPAILNPKDILVRVAMSSVCGSDLHLIGGFVPALKPGDVLGHEFLGEIVETGHGVTSLKKGDRVIVVSILACGSCEHCLRKAFSCCDNTNPKPRLTELAYGHACAGIIGYSHAFGGYAGSHAEYIRVPFGEVNAFKIPEGVRDEQAVFVSDAVPTGYMGADLADIREGDVVAVWGCGGVGLMAICSAYLLGAHRVIAIDRIPERLQLAETKGGAEAVNYEEVDVHEALKEMTGGRGPDRCIDCVGMEADGNGPQYWYDYAKQHTFLETDRGIVLRQAIRACRKGGVVSVMGVYGGWMDKFPMGAIVNKALTVRSGQQHGHRYVPQLFELIQSGKLDPSFLLTHPMPLDDGARGYAMFKKKDDNCLRAVFRPQA